jgi:hypothetical protein
MTRSNGSTACQSRMSASIKEREVRGVTRNRAAADRWYPCLIRSATSRPEVVPELELPFPKTHIPESVFLP